MKSVKMSKFAFFGLAFVCCLSLASAVQADTVVDVPNGDFLLKTLTTVPQSNPPYTYETYVPDYLTVTTDTAAPYTSVQTAPDGSGTGMWWYFGGNWGGNQGWATLQQDDIAAVHAVGDVYTLTFNAIVSQNGSMTTSVPADLTAEILVDGAAVATRVISFTTESPTPSFAPYSLSWTANTTGDLGIYFKTAAGYNYNVQTGVGHVGLSYASVPEPAMVGLLVTGLVSVLAYAWRKRK